jgi:hypothetical protein
MFSPTDKQSVSHSSMVDSQAPSGDVAQASVGQMSEVGDPEVMDEQSSLQTADKDTKTQDIWMDFDIFCRCFKLDPSMFIMNNANQHCFQESLCISQVAYLSLQPQAFRSEGKGP